MRQTPRSFVPSLLHRRLVSSSLLLLLTVLFAHSLLAQAPPAPDNPPAQPARPSDTSPQSSSTAEVVTRDSAATFKVRVNVVLVRVVVRDQTGKVVDSLKKEDFQLFDNRRPQNISTFSLETPASHLVPVVTVSDHPESDAVEKVPPAAAALPQRFVSLLFDDLHLSTEDAVYDRAAAAKILDSMSPSDRVGIFTTSGQLTQEFSSDHEALKKALNQITPRPLFASDIHDCPDISYFQADLIANKRDEQALAVAGEDAVQCAFGGDETQQAAARSMASGVAQRAVDSGDVASDYTYRHMEDTLRRLSGMPGQRKLVFISPGFILSTLLLERVDIIDRANRAGVVIDTLDARGLYTPDLGGDIASPSVDSYKTSGYKTSYRVQAQFAQEEILQDLAYGTGGIFYHNRNDIDVALRQAVAAPVASYLLGFSPQNLKFNGSFHTLKVSLLGKQKFSVQARRGYYAPRTAKDPAQTAKEEIQEAVFSQEEIHDLPVDLQAQFFRKDQAQVRLSVLAHVDLKPVKFRKAEGRNHDDLTLATVIFDENGNYVAGGEKILEMSLLDSTLDRLDRSGITVKSSFDVKPGSYLVRLVVRDKEGEMMAARNGAVVIPN
ncbi:MAG TPA: VWA domain-containing protein [Candidatus Bathyarchaeia archaeon]|nr:VWA domain-containing protein [Candidatus Bathyarchaeia archaeon]